MTVCIVTKNKKKLQSIKYKQKKLFLTPITSKASINYFVRLA